MTFQRHPGSRSSPSRLAEPDPLTSSPASSVKHGQAIAAVPEQDSRSDLIAAVGSHTIAQLVVSATDPHQASHLLGVLAGCEPESAAVIADAATAESQLAAALGEAPVDVLADCLAAARGVNPAVAHALTESIGGEQSTIARIRADNPWITELEIRSRGQLTRRVRPVPSCLRRSAGQP